MIDRAVTAGAPARWAAGDEVYGNDPKLRAGIAARGLGFVLAVAKDLLDLPPDSRDRDQELAALDQHQVRSWTSWMRWTILAMLAPRVPVGHDRSPARPRYRRRSPRRGRARADPP
jgi:hypothetical protein